jgi:hypothetical protein
LLSIKYAVDKLKKHHRAPLYHPALPVILLWSPKAGCTVLTNWFFFQIGLLDKAIRYHPSIHIYKGLYLHKRNYFHVFASGNPGKRTIKLVRDPYKRAVSSYFTIANYCYNKGFPNNPLSKDKERIKAKFFPHSPYEGISFKQFLYYLSDLGADYTLVDGHISKQYCQEEDYLSPRIMKLENFNKEIRRLEEKYNLKRSPQEILTAPHSYASYSEAIEFDSDSVMTPVQFRNGPMPQYESFFDKETIQLCNHVFKDDFTKYNYVRREP